MFGGRVIAYTIGMGVVTIAAFIFQLWLNRKKDEEVKEIKEVDP